MLVFACISPHAPMFLSEIGSIADRKKVKKTTDALGSLGKELAQTKPDIIIISSPHTDWGFEVPLHFLVRQVGTLDARQQSKLQNISHPETFSPSGGSTHLIQPILTSVRPAKEHFEQGKRIGLALPKDKKIAWIASGDMAHRLKKNGPYGLHPSAAKYDRTFTKLLKAKDANGIVNINQTLMAEAGECGLRSFAMLLGAIESSGTEWNPQVISYEKPFGVGYLVARLI